MDKLEHLVRTLYSMPLGYLAIFLAFGALGLAAFTIYVVHSVVKRSGQ